MRHKKERDKMVVIRSRLSGLHGNWRKVLNRARN